MTDRIDTSSCDVLVVGTGNAAMTAAISARQSGANVLMIDKAPKDQRSGNSRFSGALFRFAYESVEDLKPLRPDVGDEVWARVEAGSFSRDDYMDEIMRVSHGRASPELNRVLVDESLPTMRWMTDLGVQWVWCNLWSMQTDERLRFSPGAVLESRDIGIGLTNALLAAAEREGIEIAYETKMIGFEVDKSGRVVGARVQTPKGAQTIGAGALILASGGFEANAEMRARYLGPGWDQVKVRGTRFNTGETLRMALELGARAVGHWQGCHATPIDGGAPDLGELRLQDRTNRLSYPFSIMVNCLGQRFIDEGEDFGGLTYAKTGQSVMHQPGGIAYQIYDTKTTPLLEKRYSTGAPIVADSIEELAPKIGVPTEALIETVRNFNAACAEGDFDPVIKDGKATRGLDPPKSNWALPIDAAPFTAYSVSCGITFTYGGIEIDTAARVIDTEGRAIAGLYATGEITGNFFHYNYPGGAGLMRGAVFGKIGGANAATEALGRGASSGK